MTTKPKTGIATSALEAREIKSPVKKNLPENKSPKITLEQLELCRRRVNNYRQTDAVAALIEHCENEPVMAKLNKVIVNIYALLAFVRQPDAQIAAFMSRNIQDIYTEAFDHFDVPAQERVTLLDDFKTKQTTVEVSLYINNLITEGIEKINNLPETVAMRDSMLAKGLLKTRGPLYNGTDIRERALLYFAALSADEKGKVIAEIESEHSPMLVRLTDKQFEKKRQAMGL